MGLCPFCGAEIKPEDVIQEKAKTIVSAKKLVFYNCPECNKILTINMIGKR
jgi:hypothetical protein